MCDFRAPPTPVHLQGPGSWPFTGGAGRWSARSGSVVKDSHSLLHTRIHTPMPTDIYVLTGPKPIPAHIIRWADLTTLLHAQIDRLACLTFPHLHPTTPLQSLASTHPHLHTPTPAHAHTYTRFYNERAYTLTRSNTHTLKLNLGEAYVRPVLLKGWGHIRTGFKLGLTVFKLGFSISWGSRGQDDRRPELIKSAIYWV